MRLRMLEQPQQQPESRAPLSDVGISTAATPTAMKKPTAAGRGWRTGSARPVACPLAAQTGDETGERPSGGVLRERGGRIGEGDRAQRAERTAPPNWTMQCMLLCACAVSVGGLMRGRTVRIRGAAARCAAAAGSGSRPFFAMIAMRIRCLPCPACALLCLCLSVPVPD